MITVETSHNNTMVFAEERRRFPRVAVALQVEIRREDADVPLRSQTTDISLGGCYVEMPLTLEIASKLNMLFWLGDQKVSAKGVVVTCHPQFGNGIQFTSMPLEGQSRLRHYLDSFGEQLATNSTARVRVCPESETSIALCGARLRSSLDNGEKTADW